MSESQEAMISRMLDWLEEWSDKLAQPDCVEQLAHFIEAVGLLNVELDPTVSRYLIWSNEQSAWWRPNQMGYTEKFAEAGWYSRAEAMTVCIKAMPGAKEVLNELPVSLRDLVVMLEVYRAEFGDRSEQWM